MTADLTPEQAAVAAMFTEIRVAMERERERSNAIADEERAIVEEHASGADWSAITRRKPRCRANRRVDRFVAGDRSYDYGYLACGRELSHEGDHCDPDAGVSWYVGDPREATVHELGARLGGGS